MPANDTPQILESQLASLLRQLGKRVACLEAAVPSPGQLEDATAVHLDRHCADIEHRLVLKLKETVATRDRLQDEARETHAVLSSLTTESLARVHDSHQARTQALEAQLVAEHDRRRVFESACETQWQQLHMAIELVKAQCDAFERTEHAQLRKWMDAQTTRHAQLADRYAAEIADLRTVASGRLEAVEATLADKTALLQAAHTTLEKVIAAEIQKRAAGEVELRTAYASSLEKLHEQWRLEMKTAGMPHAAAIATLQANVRAVGDVHRAQAQLEERQTERHSQLLESQQTALGAIRRDVESRLWQLEMQLKTTARDCQVVQTQVRTVEKTLALFSIGMRLGAGIYDITGPAAEVGMFGYAKAHQTTTGIHMRLRARAFVFEEASTLAFVSVDTGCITMAISREVVARLTAHPKIPQGTFSTTNVLLSATHTHCAPGGLSDFLIYSMHPPLKGFDKQNFECIVSGIVEAVARAYGNLQPGVIRVARGNCFGASVNRSVEAYNANPESERSKYEHDTDKEMVLWRLDGLDGFPIGMINWFAVHPTSMGSWFTLITGDNKGYASHVFEREQGNHHLLDRPRSFVAAFAQSNEGDVSPNICGPRHCCNEKQDLTRMLQVAEAQLSTARQLYVQAASAPPVAGAVRVVHQFVDYNAIPLSDKWHVYKECAPTTSPGCIGVSMLSGTTFDGRGISAIPEGLTWGRGDWLTLVPQAQADQKEKIVAFPTAAYGMSPSVLPLQLATIGDALAIAALPFETTTMAGRRLRATVQAILGIADVVVAGLANAYCGYMTTREEYAVQRYEGASTHFGPNQLVATQQQFEVLASALQRREAPPTCPPPTQGFATTTHWHTPVIQDAVPNGVEFGDVAVDVQGPFHPGQTVRVVFHAGHPKNNLRTQKTFLEVQAWRPDLGGVWVLTADDASPDTFYHWKRVGVRTSQVTVEWTIPVGTLPGRYRIKHHGDCKPSWAKHETMSYEGFSSAFVVEPRPTTPLLVVAPMGKEAAVSTPVATTHVSCDAPVVAKKRRPSILLDHRQLFKKATV
ncbi:neutral ceramidase [Achlya hypogyna]|uniref:ceramidase n=1 Tax=Achlya hypogyna TaxID=1202772 RepID=A0A1V9YXH7_ACHHY|nr:neutral ceramidase [Achlya hypogyna]